VIKRVNVDFPEHMLAMLDREAEIRGINRQALIKSWLYDRLMQAQTK
jgi:predicted DNA binding CopG/RHH family protein